jgi:hypothetical protein
LVDYVVLVMTVTQSPQDYMITALQVLTFNPQLADNDDDWIWLAWWVVSKKNYIFHVQLT